MNRDRRKEFRDTSTRYLLYDPFNIMYKNVGEERRSHRNFSHHIHCPKAGTAAIMVCPVQPAPCTLARAREKCLNEI